MTLDELTAQLALQFDATSATLQGYVNEAYKRATAESRWLTGSGTALIPADLVTGTGAGSSPVFPVDLHPIILDGALAIAYARIDERFDEAAVHEAKFLQGIAQLRERKLAQVGPRSAGLTRDEMVASLTAHIGVDSDTAAGWVNESYRRAVAESGWKTQTMTIGTTVAGTPTYTLDASVVQIESLTVSGAHYGRVGEFDIPDVLAGNATASGGLYAQTSSSGGADQVRLYPTPTETGLTIQGLVEVVPADLVAGSGPGSSPVFSSDLHTVVLDGAYVIGHDRVTGNTKQAERFEARFLDGIRKMKARKIARMRGRGPFQVRVQGYHWT